ncbi:multicopper oxidase family protein [Microbacterium cremeum]|uniref:multicopper oxidase family protein n=1 Tax=Microbacterium cremeum TaxID=2782169 RepID=UPI001886AC36|nr:multicopper oxidase family protein [Microbacterium cremeum]
MSSAVLQLLWGAVVLAAAATWALLAVRLGRTDGRGSASRTRGARSARPGPGDWGLVAAGAALLAARGGIVAALAAASVVFVQDRAWGLALSAVTAVAAVAAIALRLRVGPAFAGGAAVAAGAELMLVVVVGAPVPLWAGLAVTAAVVAATVVWAFVRLGTGRRPLAATIAAATVAVAALAAVGVGVVGRGALAQEGFQTHGHGAAPGTAAADAVAPPATPPSIPVSQLAGEPDAGAPRVSVVLRAQRQTIDLGAGAAVEAWTFGGLAGPAIVATEGDVLDVTLENVDVEAGVTAHWHGYPVPAAADGVAGVTQDAVRPGESFRTAFTLTRPGTYWYHTHQRGSEGVVRGLYGTLVVQPAGGQAEDVDVVLPVHTFGRTVVLGDSAGEQRTTAREGQSVRVRLINTDQQPQRFTVAGAPFRVLALDGADVETHEARDAAVEVPAGGRVDIGFRMPQAAVAVRAAASGTAAMVFATGDSPAPAAAAKDGRAFDPLTDVTASAPPDAATAAAIARAAASGGFDVDETYALDRLPRVVGGVPQYAYTVNGAVYPFVPSTVVGEGDVVRLTVVNRGFETHPMHPHGHTVRVLAVDGAAPASPLWLDTFDVGPGEVWEVAFVADNPGIWMDHCHNLEHAALGMVMHIAYRGVSTPFAHGGPAGNAPE